MCGCRASVPSTKQYSVNQPAPASTKKSPSAAAGMPKRIPIAKQLASIKALGKGSDLEKAFATVALVYNNSADPAGKLSKAETNSLLALAQYEESQPRAAELCALLSLLGEREQKAPLRRSPTRGVSGSRGQEKKPKYQEIISALDEESENKIDFEDFMILLVSLTLMSDLLQEIKNVKTTK
nr:PREDICTED: sentan [Haliaeetus albicilla]